MKLEAVYLLHIREFILLGQPIYKIGRTGRDILKRINDYPKGSYLITHCTLPISCNAEKLLINIFKSKFIQRKDYGNEYFEGNITDMLSEFTALTHTILQHDIKSLVTLIDFQEFALNCIPLEMKKKTISLVSKESRTKF